MVLKGLYGVVGSAECKTSAINPVLFLWSISNIFDLTVLEVGGPMWLTIISGGSILMSFLALKSVTLFGFYFL